VDQDQFEGLVRQLEAESERSPGAFRSKVFLISVAAHVPAGETVGDGQCARAGARRHENLRPERERQVHAPFLERARNCGILALSQIVSYTLYRWENNIRAAAALGVVGAGGLGQILYYHMGLLQF
jgi:hypothetical protein